MATNTSLNDANVLLAYPAGAGGKRVIARTAVGDTLLYTYLKDGQMNRMNRTCGAVTREFYNQAAVFNPSNGPAGQMFSTGVDYNPSNSHIGNRCQALDIHVVLQNTSGTDTMTVVSPWLLFSSFRLLFNNTSVTSSKSDLYTGRDLHMLYCANMLKAATGLNETKENFYRSFGARAATAGIVVAPGASVDLYFSLFDVFPGMRDYILGRTFSGVMTFQFSLLNPTAATNDALIGSSATNPASYMRVNSCRLESIEQRIQGEAALSMSVPITLRVPRFAESYMNADMSVLNPGTPNASFRLSSVTPLLARYAFFFVRDITSVANNAANAGKAFSGMDYLRIVMTKAGETSSILDQRDASSSAAATARFHRQMFTEFLGRAYPADLLVEGADAAFWRESRFGHLLSLINLSGIENGPQQECIAGISLPVTGAVSSDPDVTFDVYAAAGGLLPAQSRVSMVIWDERALTLTQSKTGEASQLVEIDLLALPRN